jgi:hypothetical protein
VPLLRECEGGLTEGLDGADVVRPLADCGSHDVDNVRKTIKQEVFLPLEVREHCHLGHASGCGDLGDRDVVEAALQEQFTRDRGDARSRLRPAAISSIWHVKQAPSLH